MKLLLYEKFWDSFMRLNKTTQGKVLDFMKKFRENPTSAAIHLEPISTFKDGSLRTARVDQKYRAIIKAPQSGDSYYLMWVDNHDEAMDWARNKVFEWNDNTQSMQIFSVPDQEIMLPSNQEPEKTVLQGLSAYPDQSLIELGVPAPLLSSVKEIRDMSDLEAFEPYLPAEVFEYLFFLLDGAEIQYLIEEIREGKVASQEQADQEQSANNQRSFIELTDDEVFNQILTSGRDKWKFYLHPSQRKFVEGEFKGPVKLSGGAGTGKTVAAIHRLKALSGRVNQDQPILFTTFTRALTENLGTLIDELGVARDRYSLTHVDSLAFELARKYGLLSGDQKVFGLSAVDTPEAIWEEIFEEELIGYDREFLQEEYEQVVLYHNLSEKGQYFRVSRKGRGRPLTRRMRAEVWKFLLLYRERTRSRNLLHKAELYNLVTNHVTEHGIFPFSHAIVDELQDFSNVELRFIRSLVEEGPNDLFLVGDPLQSIYGRTINFTQAGINVRGKRSRRLRINYRTSEEIKRLAVSIILDTAFDNFDGEEEEKKGYVSLFHGEEPTYQLFRSKNEEIQAILNRVVELREHEVPLSEIAIASRTKGSLKELSKALYRERVPFFESHSGKNIGDKSGIRLLTFHSIKGLEFSHVMLIDVNSRTAPLHLQQFDRFEEDRKDEYLKSEKSLLYVASSRAIKSLSLFGTGHPSSLIST